MIQVVKYYAGMKKKAVALHVLMREDHQDRWLGEKKRQGPELCVWNATIYAI